MKVGDAVMMVDRYANRVAGGERSWFHGMRGKVTAMRPRLMVLLDGERLPMVFDERDIVEIDLASQPSMTGAE